MPSSPADQQRGALSGLRIAELGCGLGTAYATKLIADLGGEVIKIEPVGGDRNRDRGPFADGGTTSTLFAYLNTSKKSVTVDYETARGRELARQLCRRCNAVVIDADSLQQFGDELEPAALAGDTGLLVVSLRSLPKGAPYAKGYDLQAQALSGVCHQMGDPRREPLMWRYGVGGYQAGLVAAIALLGLLYGRDAHDDEGDPVAVDVSTLAVLSTLIQGHGAYVYRYFRDVPQRHGARAKIRAYPTGFFPCKDGLVAIHSADQVMWQRLVAMMGNPEWTTQPEFRDRIRTAQAPEAADRHFLPWLASRTQEQLFTEALERRLSLVPVTTNADVAASPQLEARGYWHEIDDGAGTSIRVPGAPYKMSRTPTRPRPAPSLGEHTRAVMSELLQRDAGDVQRLKEAGVV